MRIDFLILGAQKSGTTSLAHQLGQHPEVSFCRVKEPHYFSLEADRGKSISWYHDLFPSQSETRLGEGSTSYTFFPEYPDTVDRIFRYNPSMRLIYLVRNPISRIESQLTHDTLRGHLSSTDPEQAVFEDPRYLDRSRYLTQISRYLERFDRSSIHIEVFERMVADPSAALQRVLTFLGLDVSALPAIDLQPRNASLNHGHLRSLPAVELTRRAALRLPTPVVDVMRPWARRVGRGWLYRRALSRVELPQTVCTRVRDGLQNEVAGLERMLGSALPEWR